MCGKLGDERVWKTNQLGFELIKKMKSFTCVALVTFKGWCDPQMGTTLATVAVNPGLLVVASEKNLTHMKLPEVVTAAGALEPQ